jgi:hypothetical protein
MSEVKVNKISPRSGTTVTLGDSGDTFTIPSGATINNQGTATNFGATGSASWTTTVKTSGFTAVAGEGYFVDTSSGAISVNLPAGSAGAVVAFKDYLNSFDTHNLTLVQNGSDKIGGSTNNASLSTEGIAVTLIFIDSTRGWLVTDDGLQSVAVTDPYIIASGGTETTSGDFKIHTFTGPGSFSVSNAGNPAGSDTVDYLVVAGGGGGTRTGGGSYGGAAGGGAGGFRESPGTASGSYSVSPLGASPAVALPVTATSFPITVGAGGAGGASNKAAGASGGISTFSTITSAGGGNAGGELAAAGGGGSGGGGNSSSNNPTGGAGNTPPVNPPQGNPGGTRSSGDGAPAGGGATAVGSNNSGNTGGAGGAGATTSISATPTGYAGGGGGGGYGTCGGAASPCGTGGAGGSQSGPGSTSNVGAAGTTNRGGGGGGGAGSQGVSTSGNGGNGGSGS